MNVTTLRALYGLSPKQSLHPAKTALLLVDFQEEFFSGALPIPRGDAAVRRARALLEAARRLGMLVVHVRNVAAREDALVFRPGSPFVEIVPPLAPLAPLAPLGSELVVTKSMAGSFTRTDLDATLRARGVDGVIVAGIMTHLAVDSTVRDAAVLGYDVIVAADATATRDLPGVDHEALQRAALASLGDRFADVRSVASILEALP